MPKRPKIGSNLIEHLAGVLTVLIAPNSRVENLQFSRGKIFANRRRRLAEWSPSRLEQTVSTFET